MGHQQTDIGGRGTQEAQPFTAELFSSNTFRENGEHCLQFCTHQSVTSQILQCLASSNPVVTQMTLVKLVCQKQSQNS